MPTWISDLPDTARAALIPAAGLVALAVLVLIWRSLRKQAADTLAVRVAVLLASAFSAQGMYEVATTKLHLPPYLAAGLFAVAEMGMLASAVRAHRFYERTGQLGPHARFVWAIAVAAGVIVSLNAHSPSEYFLRLLMPLLVAGLWRMGYVAEEVRAKAADAITLRWTPRRLGILLGIIEPGERDLATVNAERQRRQMIAHAHAFHRGSLLLGAWHASRLRKLALMATDDTIAEVQRSVDRVHRIEASTAPKTERVGLSGGWWRKPWRATRQLAVLATQLGSERDSARDDVARLNSETAQLATSVRELTARLDSAQRTHLAELDAAKRDADGRVEAERVARDEASREIESLRETLHRSRPRESSRPGNRGTATNSTRRNQQVLVTIGNDDEVADSVYDSFAKRADETGELPTGHWVLGTATESGRKVSSRQAYRVVEILRARYTESGQRDESAPRESGDSADDSERQLAEPMAV